MKILLLCSGFNGLTQRSWLRLRDAGHDVSLRVAGDRAAIIADVAAVDPDLIICPFLRHRVPAEVWNSCRTIIIHPGPKGDRGPSSLDWAITTGSRRWGVTALQAVEEMDAGPIWASRDFPMPVEPPRKSSLYNGPVSDIALELIDEVVDKADDPTFVPEPLDYSRPDTWGRLRPKMQAEDRTFCWSDTTDEILRHIRAADGSPGARTQLCGLPVAVFDAHRGPALDGRPGEVLRRRQGAVLVRTPDGALWIGHLRRLHGPATEVDSTASAAVKLPATMVLRDRLARMPHVLDSLAPDGPGHREITYRRSGHVGVLTFDFANGAMSTGQCRRLAAALDRALAKSTRVLVIRGGETFSNGIHLNVIHAASDPATEAWRNITAIDEVCRRIITATDQLVVAAVGGNAGAGGVMMALGADRVVLRDGVVLNPHYATMGLFGSEYWTYVLPRRAGTRQAQRLTEQCLPISAAEAQGIGLADAVLHGPVAAFDRAVLAYATDLAESPGYRARLAAKRARRMADEQDRPLETYRVRELTEMSHDIFEDRSGFAAARHAFVTKQRPEGTPDHLRRPAGLPVGHVRRAAEIVAVVAVR